MNEQLKLLRKELNITQQEFADRLRISRNTVATYEAGKSNPSDAAISLICREFSVNEEWLRTGIGEMFNSLEEDEYAVMVARIDIEDPRMKQAIIDYCHLKPKEKELFWNFVDTFIRK